MLKSFTIDDDISVATTGAVEITVELQNGQRRWCFFITPEALSQCGDLIPDTQVRVHFGETHMVVVSQLDEQIIKKTLSLIDKQGELETRTLSNEVSGRR